MINKVLKLEYYPQVPDNLLVEAISTIQTNQAHWDPPFFMDVYKYADLTKFTEVCQPFINDPKLRNLIILGTGGSYQTMKALELFSEKHLHFLTSSRPHELAKVLSTTSPSNSLVIPISRGGKTLDINSILPLFKEYKILALSSQGPMNDLVKSLNATILPVPDLSGRYAASICSVVLVPALLAGISTAELQRGLEQGYATFKDLENRSENLAVQYASFLAELYKKGYRNVFSMPYSAWVDGLTGLFVQEISESSGKDGAGIMGTYQAAPLCQHSVLELILGGTKGYVSPLLWTTAIEPTDVPLKGDDPKIEGQTALNVINYQLDATFQALLEQKIPTAKLSLLETSLFSFGVSIAFIQSVSYYFSLLLDVNWSSNPMVNVGKKICNDALQKKLDLKSRITIRQKIAFTEFSDFY